MKPLLRRKNAEQRRAGIGAYTRKRPPGVEPAKINKLNLINVLTRNVPVIDKKGAFRRAARRKQLQMKPLNTLVKMVENRGLNNTRKGLPHSNLSRDQLIREFRKYNRKTRTNSLSNQNLMNYLASRHFKRHIVQNLNTRNNSIRVQYGGTCWFHTLLNGWLLSGNGRKILISRVQFTNPNPELDNICPVRSKIPSYFWNYIKFELSAPKDHIWANVRLQNKYHESNLIRATGLRKGDNVSGGTYRDMEPFMNFIAPGNWSKKPGLDICILHYGRGFKEIHPPPGYQPSHAYIALTSSNPETMGRGHAITGYVRNGEYKIADSNSTRPIPCDWFHDVRDLEKYAHRKKYEVAMKEGFYVTRTIVYIKENPSDRLFAPWQQGI
jgi:hypothetical protein